MVWIRYDTDDRRTGFPARRLGDVVNLVVLDRDDPQQLGG
jgi:hypothetical protein